MGEVLKVGYLKKKGHVRRNWLDRWFVLTSEGIYYYKTKEVGLLIVFKCRSKNVILKATHYTYTHPQICGLYTHSMVIR